MRRVESIIWAVAVAAILAPAAEAQITRTLAGSGGREAVAETQTIPGALELGDRTLQSGQFVDVLPFQGYRGQRLTVRMVSTDFNAYLIVQTPSGRTFQDDDGGKGTHARLVVDLAENGTYRIAPTSSRPGETGAYVLEMRIDGGRLGPITGAGPRIAPRRIGPTAPAGFPTQGVRPVGDGGPAYRPAPRAGRITITPRTRAGPAPDVIVAPEPVPLVERLPAGEALVAGRSVTGALGGGDDALGGGQLVDWYTFTGSAGDQVVLDLSSGDFDTYLVVRAPSGAVDENDDVAPGNTDSRLAMTLQETGTYLVGVSSYRAGEAGGYALRFLGGDGGQQAQTPPAETPAERSLTGALAGGDDRLSTGEYIDWYSFTGRVGQTVTLDLSSREFDTYLVLLTPTGEQFDNDDIEEGITNSRILRRLDEAGDYRVGVTSYQAGETGRYALTIALSEGAAPPPPDETPAPNVAQGTSRSGRLENGDATLSTGEFVDSYTFDGEAGQPVRVDMQSTEIDSYLILRFPSGRQVDNDDASPTNRNSLIEIVLPESGTYRVLATSYRAGEIGSYDLGISVGDIGPEEAGPAIDRVPDQNRQYYGVFVGISDYPPGVGDLPYCREDAEKLARSFQQIGLMDSSHADVIVDSMASERNVRTALRRMARRVGPEDVFVFFYSGHGNQGDPDPEAHPDELDGRQESIILGQDEYTDDEMAADLDGIRAGLTVVALDSCFAGGFARDVISKPGRVGFFSSEEDLTSNVASEFQAGGYLSLFFRRAIEGHADENRDGLLQIGELSHYIQDQYAEHVRRAESETAEGAAGYQHLVVDRGAVRVDTLFSRTGRGGAPERPVPIFTVSTR